MRSGTLDEAGSILHLTEYEANEENLLASPVLWQYKANLTVSSLLTIYDEELVVRLILLHDYMQSHSRFIMELLQILLRRQLFSLFVF